MNSHTDISYYFVIDLMYSDAFGHWVYESAIYLPIFKKLKEMYSNIKVVLKERKDFKSLFLNFFNISPSEVIYIENMSATNVCFFPSPISSLNDNIYFTENYKQILNRFIQLFHNYKTEKKVLYDCIVLPRQSKENYINNNRYYNFLPIYTFLKNTHMTYNMLHTDEVTDLVFQIQTLRSAPNIILTGGSPFLVNNMFCINSKIAILDTITLNQANIYVKIKNIIDTVCKINNNRIEYIPKEINFHFQAENVNTTG